MIPGGLSSLAINSGDFDLRQKDPCVLPFPSVRFLVLCVPGSSYKVRWISVSLEYPKKIDFFLLS